MVDPTKGATQYRPHSQHTTTMQPSQRAELVRILCDYWSFEQLSKLNDLQLHKQWLADCEYIPASEAPLGVPNDKEDDDER